jgi:2'-hydroxyisoflavone reductase
MTLSRRDFIRDAALAGAAAALLPSCASSGLGAAPARKNILILGGTDFIGPHQINTLLARGHTVSTFTRGRTNPEMFRGRVEQLIGDRNNDLTALQGKKWDAVIDNSAESAANAPEWVKLTVEALKDSVDQYLFVSTRSAYQNTARVPMTADAPTYPDELPPGQGRSYGIAKAMAERVALAALPGRVTIVRPGLIVGPGDQTDRFTYWPVRVARGGEMIAPGDGSDHVQIIDVRDLGDFIVKLVEDQTFGMFNGVGPQGGRPFREFLELIEKGVGGDPTYTWVDADFLTANGARPYGNELPVFQVMRGNTAGFARFDLTPEINAGLRFRPLEVTAKETLDWFRTLPPERQAFRLNREQQGGLKTGFTVEREKALLALWHARKK